MNILYTFNMQEQATMAVWQNYHFIHELAHYDIHFISIWPESHPNAEAFNCAIIQAVKENDIALFMTQFIENAVFPETLDELKKYGIPTLLISYDNLLDPYIYYTVARYFDLVWITSRETEYLFKKHGANTLFLPYAANPFLFTPGSRQNTCKKAVFCGTPYGSRAAVINKFDTLQLPIDVLSNNAHANSGQVEMQKPESAWSYKWRDDSAYHFRGKMSYAIGRRLLLGAALRRMKGISQLNENSAYIRLDKGVPVEQLGKIYGRYSLSLSMSGAQSTEMLRKPVDVVNLRDFEIPMCGGLQFCRYVEELSGYFEEDKEIVFYRSDEEMAEKYHFYTAPERDDLVQSMMKAARDRAYREHTWMNRFSAVFRALNIPVPNEA